MDAWASSGDGARKSSRVRSGIGALFVSGEPWHDRHFTDTRSATSHGSPSPASTG